LNCAWKTAINVHTESDLGGKRALRTGRRREGRCTVDQGHAFRIEIGVAARPSKTTDTTHRFVENKADNRDPLTPLCIADSG